MIEIKDFLKQLITAPGLSGYETPVRSMIEQTWQPLVDEVHASRLGSLHALRKGNLPEPRPSILLAAHMDAIGLMVNGVVDGFLRLTSIGGLDPRVLPGQLVTVHGRVDLPGMIIQPPAHLLPAENEGKTVALEYLWVDVGLLPAQVKRQVRIGDLVSFAQQPFEMGKDFLAGHSLDNRASVAAVTACLENLQNRRLKWDLWAVATAQEEETLGGAATSAFQLRPSLAIAIDVTFGASPGSPSHETFPVGKGITLGWGPNIHPKLFSIFKELAERLEIPTKVEVMPRNSGTDAMALQVAAEGIPSMVIGIPLKYMHTPVEVVSMKDIFRTGRLLAEFAAMLDEKFLDQLSLDD
ncbi:MAG TPA: M20/M25/M40 family metallo-hydrolase [Anaerolineales bacterium]|nr:M20/M25/M40 family metallo-hydrolase [Anaerolineales bacterium]